jgi:imidazolonepropionase-like amidohydrolase
LTPGKKADLLFIEGNPLEDVSGLVYGKDVNLVIKNGEVAYTKSVR